MEAASLVGYDHAGALRCYSPVPVGLLGVPAVPGAAAARLCVLVGFLVAWLGAVEGMADTSALVGFKFPDI